MHFLPEELDNYVDLHSGSEDSILRELRRETHQKVLNPRMLSGEYQGKLLSFLSKLIRPELILEIGTYTGYSALCLASGMDSAGELHTIDVNPELEWIRKKYFDQSPYSGQLHLHHGEALDLIPSLNLSEIDLLFIDADKSNYLKYYELCLPLMREGGLILIDNVLWSGKVLQEAEVGDTDTLVLQALNDRVQTDERVDRVMLPVRDGLLMVRKRS